MKILLLNPHVDAEHKLVLALQSRGFAVLVAESAEDVLQMLRLHGSSIDLAIIHREGIGAEDAESGLHLLGRLKADSANAELPVIFTSHVWGDSEFSVHQETSAGANAYLRWPFAEAALIEMITTMFDSEVGSKPDEPSVGLVLEDASLIFTKSEKFEPSDTSIKLAAPDLIPPVGGLESAVEVQPTAEVELIAPPAYHEPAVEISIEGPSIPTAPSLPMVESGGDPEFDPQAEAEMPYLFGKGARSAIGARIDPEIAFAQPLGNAVVPGGAAHSPDLDTLKKYLLLREQDVAVLSSQLKATQEQVAALETTLRDERGRNVEIQHTVEEQKRKIVEFEKEEAQAVEALQSEMGELRFQTKARSDKAKVLEQQVREATNEMERLKERVRSDIRKIRVREKELENRLEIVRKDSEALIGSRENKIIELKRKLDLLEFNMDLLQDQYAREKESTFKLRERLAKAAQVVRMAGGMLDPLTGEPTGESGREAS